MKTTLFLLTIGILTTLVLGIICMKKNIRVKKQTLKKIIAINAFSMILLFVVGLVPDVLFAAEATKSTQSSGLGFIGAALSTGLASVGAGIGVGQAGSAAIGAISEDSSILGKTLIILGLAEGIAIYGLVISIMILQKL